MNASRFRAWLIPATGLSLALMAVGLLVASEIIDGELENPSLAPLNTASAAPAPAQPRKSSLVARPAPVVIPAQEATVADLGAGRRLINPGKKRPKLKDTKNVRAASWHLVKLARAKDLRTRLRLVKEFVVKLPEDRAVALLSGLLDAQLPGSFYEAENLRLGVLARIGKYPGPTASAALVARLDPEQPRPQRLIALELLAPRSHAGRAEITNIARSDHDPVVKKKAQWLLRHHR